MIEEYLENIVATQTWFVLVDASTATHMFDKLTPQIRVVFIVLTETDM